MKRAHILFAAICGTLLLVGLAEAKGGGGGHSGGSPASARTVSVQGYTKSDGTHVAGYMRAPPGTLSKGENPAGVAYEGRQDDEIRIVNLDAPARASSSHASYTKASASTCQYQPVMTDEQIEQCKAEARRGN